MNLHNMHEIRHASSQKPDSGQKYCTHLLQLCKGHFRRIALSMVSLILGISMASGELMAQDTGKACAGVSGVCTLGSVATEYVSKASGTHFFTACIEEKNQLDGAPNLFSKTGRTFPMWATSGDAGQSSPRLPLARYFITVTGAEPARHFQSVLTGEKDALNALSLLASSSFCLERAVAGYAIAPPPIASLPGNQLSPTEVRSTASCPVGSRPVWRMFNDTATAPQGKSVKPQHRFSASWAEVEQTIALNGSNVPADAQSANWVDEGTRFCVPGSDQWISLTIDQASLQPATVTAGSAVYALRFTLDNNANAGTAVLLPIVATQLPPGLLYQSAAAGAACTADASNATGQRVLCASGALSPGGKGFLTLNVTATAPVAIGIGVSAVALGSLAGAPTPEQAEQLWPLACVKKATPAYGCDKAMFPSIKDTAKQAAAKLSFEGSFSATPTSQLPSPVTVGLSGLTLRAGSTTTPLDLQFYVEYQAVGSTFWLPVPLTYVNWSSPAVVSQLISPKSVANIAATINYPATLPNPTVSLRICARVMDASNAFDGAGACASLPINEGLTKVSDAKSVNVGTISSAVPPVLAIENVATQIVQPSGSLPAIIFPVSRQKNSNPPTEDLTCQIVAPVLGYSCLRSGTLLGSSTSASCACTTTQSAPSSGAHYLTVYGTATGATTSSQVTATLQVYTPPAPATDYSKLTWLSQSISRNQQSNALTFTATVKNTGSVDLQTWIGLRTELAGVVGSVSGATVTTPANGITPIAAGATQSVSVSVPATVLANTKLFACAARINVFDSLPATDCSQSAVATVDTTSSATVTVPALASPYWAVRGQQKISDTATPTDITAIDLSILLAGDASPTFLVGCFQQSPPPPEVGPPPLCNVTFTMADDSQRQLPANPLTLGADYSLFFRGADAKGNLTICAGKSWSDTTATGCNTPVLPDALALAVNSLTITIGTANKTIRIQRNEPPPKPDLKMVEPPPLSVTSGAALPVLTFAVSRQNPSIAPTTGLSCKTDPNPLKYSCEPAGDIEKTTAAACVCTPSPATAPTVAASQPYTLAVVASAGGAKDGTGSVTVTVQPVSSSRGCTDDTSVPVIREIDFATDASFGKELYPFSTVGEGVTNPPSVAAIRLKVAPGGGLWQYGVLQIGPGRGTSTAEGVISRCRGRFDEGGRVQVIRLDGYTGPGNASPITFAALWWVDPTGPRDVYTAALNAPGRTSTDGWLSDGIYYVNMRQTWCSGGFGGTCQREIAGTGARAN